MSREIVIVAAARTPVGRFGGMFQDMSAVDLGAAAVTETVRRAGLRADGIEEMFFGNVLGAGLGQNVARQVLIKSAIPQERGALTVNKVCGSGLRAVALAAQCIKAGDADIIMAGGTESMSMAPYVLRSARWGQRMGDGNIVDSMVWDGLTDAFHGYHMGITAENVARQFGVSRRDQDLFALSSQNKAEKAIKSGRFKDEIIPVAVPRRKGEAEIFDTDEYPRFGSTLEALSAMKPAFQKDGTVTAGNASGINDGAAAVLVASAEKAKAMKLPVLARIRSYASSGVDPAIMGIAPVEACRKAMKSAGVSIKDIDLVEANEAFAAVSVAVARGLDIPDEKINPNGGAIALGHPIGASGGRILITLLFEMIKRGSSLGMATLCIGGGQGVSMILERV
ncbi:MAG: acetyl-CoA C-acetyltransferase [Desulfarculales bacterium]|jgi:acetyl-CoA C-acetyltransferase|nr:acetyl-CoA C-acetyltransferase [Desulfarculales bacterium]